MGLTRGIFRLKTTANGVFGAENGSQRDLEGWVRGLCRRSEVGGSWRLKTGRNYEMREKRENWGWRGGPRSEIGGPRSEKHHPCRSVFIRGWFWALEGARRAENGQNWHFWGSGGPTKPIFDRKWGIGRGNFAGKQERNGPSSCFPVFPVFLERRGFGGSGGPSCVNFRSFSVFRRFRRAKSGQNGL